MRCSGLANPSRDAGEDPQLGVGRLDDRVRHAVDEPVEELEPVGPDPAGQLDERRDAAAGRPRAPLLQQRYRGVVFGLSWATI